MRFFARHFFLCTCAFIFLFLLASCVSLPKVQSQEEEDALFAPDTYIPQKFEWLPVAEGIERFDFLKDSVAYTVVKINLKQTELDLVPYPNKKESGARQVQDFAMEHGCTIAFNTLPFTGDIPPKLMGVHYAEGIFYSSCIERYSSLLFYTQDDGSLRAKISETQDEAEVLNADFAFGGFFAVLVKGQVQEFKHFSYEARLGAGLSADGGTLFIMLVRSGGAFHGLSYPQCARIFLAMGCTDALEFDGGHSAELFVKDQSIRGTSLTRKQAAMLGFKKRSL